MESERYNQFDFLKKRLSSSDPTEGELLTFDPFMTQMALSMKRGTDKVLDKINTKQFFNLSKKIQCYAYTAFDGKDVSDFWKKSKSSAKKENKEIINMIMKVLDCSHSTAVSYIQYELLDMNEIEEIYISVYEPESIKFRAVKGKK